jgi:hypothetical protein
VQVVCRCGRKRIFDGSETGLRDRAIMGARFRCITILPHRACCNVMPTIPIGKRGRWQMTMAERSRTILERQGKAPIDAEFGTFAHIVQRGEVAFLHDQGCLREAQKQPRQ